MRRETRGIAKFRKPQAREVSVDQRSDHNYDRRSEHSYDELFDDRVDDDREETKSPDYNVNDLFYEEERVKQPSANLDAWEKLTKSLEETSPSSNLKKVNPTKKAQNKWTEWFGSRRKLTRKPAVRKAWVEY